MDYSDITQLGIGTTQLLRGWTELVNAGNTTLGQSFTRSTPPETWERLSTVYCNYVASAVVATRYPYVQVSDADGNIVYFSYSVNGIAASQSRMLSCWVGSPIQTQGSAGIIQMPIPDMVIPSGFITTIGAFNIDVGDQIKSVILRVQRYPSDLASGDAYHEHLEAWREFWKNLRSGTPTAMPS